MNDGVAKHCVMLLSWGKIAGAHNLLFGQANGGVCVCVSLGTVAKSVEGEGEGGSVSEVGGGTSE